MLYKNDRLMIFRSTRKAHPHCPLSVRSTGHYQVTPSWSQKTDPKHFLQLYWTVQGEGNFWVGKRRTTSGPGDLFIYRPGEPHHTVPASSDEWHYFWVTLDHPKCLTWLAGFGLTKRVYRPGPCPQILFEQIGAALRQATPEGERRAAHAMHALLLEATRPAGLVLESTQSLPAEAAKALLDSGYADTGLSVSDLAEKVGIHRSTLFRLFSARYGLTPSRYLQNLRLQKALALLQEPGPMQEVARKAGYADPNYFSRAVRTATGMSPWELRHGTRHHG